MDDSTKRAMVLMFVWFVVLVIGVVLKDVKVLGYGLAATFIIVYLT